MVETGRQGMQVWKTFELTLLFHGLEARSDQLPTVHKVGEMKIWRLK